MEITDLRTEIRDSLHHPAHRLRLRKMSPRDRRRRSCTCDACCCVIDEQYFFRCDAGCDFDLHTDCVSLSPNIKHPLHDEHLVILARHWSYKSKCASCGSSILGGLFFRCVVCDVDFHYDCRAGNQLPPTLVSQYHEHVLALGAGNEFNLTIPCAICEDEIEPTVDTFYICAECDSYCTHRHCVVDQIIFDKRERLRHFTHQHLLVLQETEDKKDGVFCYACEKVIEGPAYGCNPCLLYLHQSCAKLSPVELPNQRNHPFHQHSLTLETPLPGIRSCPRKCSACHRSCYGLTYGCSNSNCNFYLDLDCLSLWPLIKLEGHEHLLAYFDKLHDVPKCVAGSCRFTSPDAFYLRCVRCDFNIHLPCSPLVQTINLKNHHQHSLVRMESSNGVDDVEYHCDNCKTKRQCIYYCAECHYALDLSCLILEVIFSLKGDELNKSSREGTITAVAGRKWGKIEARNSLLHKHPLTFCENWGELPCPDCVSSFLFQHNGYCLKYPFYVEHCAACKRATSGSFYFCKMCWPYSPIFHRSCTEYEPLEIQSSLHPQHSLHLEERTGKCSFCNVSTAVRRHSLSEYKYCCWECDFQIHHRCALLVVTNHEGREHAQHFSHAEHPLTLLEVWNEDCRICNRKIFGPSYACTPCDFFIHTPCSELPQEIHHMFHPSHHLILRHGIEREEGFCDACLMPLGSYYQCSYGCRFKLHSECVSRMPNIKSAGHYHLLTLVDNKYNGGHCQGCHLEIMGTSFVRCVECDINFHVQCHTGHHLQLTIVDKHHDHPLTLTTPTPVKDNSDLFHCAACNRETNTGLPFYSCIEHDYFAHVHCVITETQSSEEELKHFSHEHKLILNEKEKHDDVICSACEKSIDGPTYACNDCSLYLHKFCAELPRKIIHPFHKHSLSLPAPYSEEEHQCNACNRRSFGFTYSCNLCNFHVDLDCILLRPSIKHQELCGHTLTYFEKLDVHPKCEHCNIALPNASYFRCVICNLSVHLRCGWFPESIQHWSHQHQSLTLMSRCVGNNYNVQICDVCEVTGRDPWECIYYCKECDFIAELSCTQVFNYLEGDQNPDVPMIVADEEYFYSDDDKEENSSDTEEEKKDFEKVEEIRQKIIDHLVRNGGGGWQAKVIISEKPPYSDADFTRFISTLNYASRLPEMGLVERNGGEEVSVGDYSISHKLAPVLESLIEKHGDIATDCILSTKWKMIYLSIFCGVVLSMGKTTIVNISEELMCCWWFAIKTMQHAGFKIDFAMDHLQRIAYACYITYSKHNTNNSLHKVHDEMIGLCREIDKQNARMEQLMNEKHEAISTYLAQKSRLKAESLVEAFEFLMNNAGTGLI